MPQIKPSIMYKKHQKKDKKWITIFINIIVSVGEMINIEKVLLMLL